MKTISTIKDVDTLVDGKQYVIVPKGFDPSKGPENMLKHSEKINELQTHIEKRFMNEKQRNDKS